VVVGDPLAGQDGTQPAADTATTADTRGTGMLPGATEASLSAEDQDYLTQLMDPSPEVRADAAESIEPVGIALDYLATIVTSDPSAEVRIAAAETLEDSKDPRALEALILALQDEHPEVLAVVIEALEYMENRLAVPYLQPFLEHPDEDVRDAAEYALDQFN
jgi:HEAT repeat protein